ncbi:MAG: hypothetical protein ACT4TC_16210 [Myxococcaceae bacterium]
MKRGLALFTVAAVMLSSPVFAQDEAPPSGDGEQSVTRKPGALFDTSVKDRPMMLSGFVGLPFFGIGFGLAPRFSVPIVKEGFIPTLNDWVDIEFGFDLNFHLGPAVSFVPAVEGRWNFQITPEFAAYGKAGFGIGYWGYTGLGLTPYSGLYGYPIVAVGLLYKIGGVFLRAEGGVPWVKVGVGIPF